MQNRSVFEFHQYQALMRDRLTGPENRGQLKAAAEALHCQRPYLSRVIAEEIHLTPEHAFNLARFFGLSESEREYFLTLVESARAGGKEYRNHLADKAAAARAKYQSIAERTERGDIALQPMDISYFSSWLYSAIHFLCSIPEFQTEAALARRLQVNAKLVQQCLQFLAAQGLVENANGKWRYRTGAFHAPKNSPQVLLHHQNWRQRAILDAQDFETQGVHYTAVQTMSRADAEKIKNLLLDFISLSSQIAGPSAAEDCVVVSCDLFSL